MDGVPQALGVFDDLGELAPQGNLLDARFEWTGELPDRASFERNLQKWQQRAPRGVAPPAR